MLAISGALRATDGSPELLAREPARSALADLPQAVSVWDVAGGGLLVESRSAVGSLTYLTAFL